MNRTELALATLASVGLVTCSHPKSASPVASKPAMAATSSVTRMAAGKGPRDSRIIPLGPMTGDVEILYGDPDTPNQPFVMRIHELPGAIVPPHTHPVDENITVLQGTWYFALGDKFDPKRLHELKAGTYAFAPAGSSMFGFCPDGAIVQIHGIGPFHIHWSGGLHTLRDADSKQFFQFPRGAAVVTPRGNGEIAEGYASGNVVQYEIKPSNGEHFMVNESDLKQKQP